MTTTTDSSTGSNTEPPPATWTTPEVAELEADIARTREELARNRRPARRQAGREDPHPQPRLRDQGRRDSPGAVGAPPPHRRRRETHAGGPVRRWWRRCGRRGSGPGQAVDAALEAPARDGGVGADVRQAHPRGQHRRAARPDADASASRPRPSHAGCGQAGLARRPDQAVVALRRPQDRPRVLRRPVHRPRRGTDLLLGARAVPGRDRDPVAGRPRRAGPKHRRHAAADPARRRRLQRRRHPRAHAHPAQQHARTPAWPSSSASPRRCGPPRGTSAPSAAA